jgi:putative aminopeptidase FrvX
VWDWLLRATETSLRNELSAAAFPMNPLRGRIQAEPGTGKSFVLALGMHLVLAAFLTIGLSWKSQTPAGLEAEIWDNVPVIKSAPANIDPKIDADEKADIALKKKKDREKAQTIVLTAHYDHLGAMGIHTYFPGANDNASGVAMLFELAKYFKENPLDYNVMFIAFAGEEAGLVGSKYYVEHPIIPLSTTRFVLNLDIMGSGEEGITVVNATLFPKEMEALQKINVREKLLTQIKPRGPAANSDHYWFTQAGVPAFFVYTMGPNKNYHDIFDTYSNLSFQETNDLLKLLLEFVRTIEE